MTPVAGKRFRKSGGLSLIDLAAEGLRAKEGSGSFLCLGEDCQRVCTYIYFCCGVCSRTTLGAKTVAGPYPLIIPSAPERLQDEKLFSGIMKMI